MAESLKGRIAIIGWGSLIWDLDDLAPKVEGAWLMGAGPRLPMEFSRVSPKRKQALAVCLDATHGAPCQTNAILSVRGRIDEAAEDLRARERAKHITFIGAHFGGETVQAATPAVADAIANWCLVTGAAGAVWTDLDPNYQSVRGEPFSVDRGMAYLRSLSGESLIEAVRYIEYAPSATDTPLRRALAAEEWWRALAEEYAGSEQSVLR